MPLVTSTTTEDGMAVPTVSASLDKAKYAPGETMTLTVNYSDTDTQSVTVTVTASDSSGNSSNPVNVSCVIDPVSLSVSDSGGRVWTVQSDNGQVAVLSAVA